jgi:hypothetical protein
VLKRSDNKSQNYKMRYSAAYPTGRESVLDESFGQGLYECVLPEYLKHDLVVYLKGKEEGSQFLDCLWGELYSSINIAEINDRAITHEQAQYLRNKYLWGVEV